MIFFFNPPLWLKSVSRYFRADFEQLQLYIMQYKKLFRFPL